jgi:hypothetical protein
MKSSFFVFKAYPYSDTSDRFLLNLAEIIAEIFLGDSVLRTGVKCISQDTKMVTTMCTTWMNRMSEKAYPLKPESNQKL